MFGLSASARTREELAPAEGEGAPPREVTVLANDIGAVGGMERVLAHLILGLREVGHEVTVISRVSELPPSAGVRFRRIPGPRKPFPIAYPWFMLLSTVMLGRWRRGVVISTGAITLAKVDVVAVHYCHQVGPTNTDRTTFASRLNGLVTRRIKRTMERISFAASDAGRFACVSEGVADELRRAYPQLASRVITIHNGVDTDAFRPGARSEDARALRARLGIAEGRLLAAFVGGEWDRKGLGPAIEALAAAGEWDLVVAGSGDERRYRALAGQHGVAGRVHWLGVTQDIAPVYEAAQAFVFPSSYETFSLVTFEAAASGLPIIATSVNGVRELIEDGRTGLLVTQDPAQIATRLRELGGDPELRGRLGEAARTAVQRFTWNGTVSSYHDLVQLLGSSRAA